MSVGIGVRVEHIAALARLTAVRACRVDHLESHSRLAGENEPERSRRGSWVVWRFCGPLKPLARPWNRRRAPCHTWCC